MANPLNEIDEANSRIEADTEVVNSRQPSLNRQENDFQKPKHDIFNNP